MNIKARGYLMSLMNSLILGVWRREAVSMATWGASRLLPARCRRRYIRRHQACGWLPGGVVDLAKQRKSALASYDRNVRRRATQPRLLPTSRVDDAEWSS